MITLSVPYSSLSAKYKSSAVIVLPFTDATIWLPLEVLGILLVQKTITNNIASTKIIINEIAKAGEKLGMNYETCLKLSAQTAYGSAKMIMDSGISDFPRSWQRDATAISCSCSSGSPILVATATAYIATFTEWWYV